MTRSDAARELRAQLVDCVQVCEALGLERSRTERGKWICPRHGGGSLSVRTGSNGTMQAHCFGCDLAGDVFALIAEAEGLSAHVDFPQVVQRAAELAGRWDLVGSTSDTQRLSSPRVHRTSPTRAGRTYPAREEVGALLKRTCDVADDPHARELVVRRGLVPSTIDDLGLARVIPPGGPTPPWARFGGRSWMETGHRLVLPVVDAFGEIRSLRAWRVFDGATPKRLPPAGHRASGLVLACPVTRAVLAGARDGLPCPLRIVVVEGEPDFLTWATRFSDADVDAPLVLGVLSGAWTRELANRIPDGAVIAIRTHHDEAGERYATEIARSLSGRCQLFRARPDGGAA